MRFKTILVLALCLLLAYCGSVFWENGARRPSQVVERPLKFLSDTELLIWSDAELKIRSIGGAPSDRLVYRLPTDQEQNLEFTGRGCFRPDKWVLDTVELTGSMRSAGPDLVLNIDGTSVTDVQMEEVLRFTPPRHHVDCDRISLVEGPLPQLENPNPGSAPIVSVPAPHLFSRTHATQVLAAFEQGFLALEYYADGASHRLELRHVFTGWGQPVRGVSSIHEPGTDYYWLFENIGGLDRANRRNWPRHYLRLDLGFHSGQVMKLPAGPWVGEYEERFACFSCGCGCYQKIELVPAGDKMFARIWGIGFPSDVQGIYAFGYNKPSPTWEQLVQGAVSGPLVVSPSGCQIAYTDGTVQMKEMCS